MSVDHGSAEPPYRQVAAILRERITSGELAPGAAVPSVRTLQQEYGIAQTTARKALKVLVDEGLARIVPAGGRSWCRPPNGGDSRAPARVQIGYTTPTKRG